MMMVILYIVAPETIGTLLFSRIIASYVDNKKLLGITQDLQGVDSHEKDEISVEERLTSPQWAIELRFHIHHHPE